MCVHSPKEIFTSQREIPTDKKNRKIASQKPVNPFTFRLPGLQLGKFAKISGTVRNFGGLFWCRGAGWQIGVYFDITQLYSLFFCFHVLPPKFSDEPTTYTAV